MEFTFYPRGFAIQHLTAPGPTGGEQAVVAVIVQDVSGATARVVFGLADWGRFQEAVADPEGALARAKARALLLGPDGRAPSLKQRKH